MSKKSRKPKNDGHVFSTKGEKLSEDKVKELRDSVTTPGLSFDAHDLTSNIMLFGKALTGIPLYDYQETVAYRIIYSVVTIEGASLTVLFSRQSGKTESVAFTVCTLSVILPVLAKFIPELEQYKDGIKIGLFAPQSDQVETTYGRALSRISSENAELILTDPEIDIAMESDVRLELSNGSYMKGQVVSKNSKIESKTYDLVILEEAQDADDFIVQKSIEPMLSATNGTMVKVGTTGTRKCDFWHEILNNRRLDRKERDTRLVRHFENDYLKVIASKRRKYEEDGKLFHLNYEKDVLRKRQKWGEDSDAFRLSYALRWALDSGMFITDKDFERMCNKKKGFPRKVESDWFVSAGLDIAKSNASTVMTIAKVYYREDNFDSLPVKEIIAWCEFAGVDYELQHHYIMEALVEYNVQIMYCDYTGVGRPVVDRLTHSCGDYVSIIPYTFSRPSKSDMWLSLDADIRSNRLIVPANSVVRAMEEYKKFEEQLKNLQKWYEGSYLVAQKPDGDEFFDDYADSLALMVMAGNTEMPDEIEDSEDNPFLAGHNELRNQIKSSQWS